MSIDRFSSLDEIPFKSRGNAVIVLAALAKAGRFSCFEVDSRLNAAFREIKEREWATFDTLRSQYPWTLDRMGVRL